MLFVVEFLGFIIKWVFVNEGMEILKLMMRNVGDIKNFVFCNRFINEDIKEVFEIIWKCVEDLKNLDVYFDEVLLRWVLVIRLNELLFLIWVENDFEVSEKLNSWSCLDELDYK